MDYIYSDPFVDYYRNRMVEHLHYYYFENLFTEEELDYIIQWGELTDQTEGEVGGGEDGLHVIPEIRKSTVGTDR